MYISNVNLIVKWGIFDLSSDIRNYRKCAPKRAKALMSLLLKFTWTASTDERHWRALWGRKLL